MSKTLRNILIFVLGMVVALLLSLSFLAYQTVNSLRTFLAAAPSYTCRQFLYDMQQPEPDHMYPIVIATLAYGTGVSASDVVPHDEQIANRMDDMVTQGAAVAVAKVARLCSGHPQTRVLDVFAADVMRSAVSVTTVTPSPAVPEAVSSTQQQ